jgi:hypothetical protein
MGLAVFTLIFIEHHIGELVAQLPFLLNIFYYFDLYHKATSCYKKALNPEAGIPP